MKPKQTTLKAFLDISSDSEHEQVSEYTPSPQKGAPKLPDMWTRVKSREQMSHSHITVFDIEKDLEADKTLKAVRLGATREKGELLFDPDEWKGKSEELTIDKCKLSIDELRVYAKIASELRTKFLKRAIDFREEAKDACAIVE